MKEEPYISYLIKRTFITTENTGILHLYTMFLIITSAKGYE